MVSQDKVAFICKECAGSKNLATKASWTAHMKSFHPKVLQAQADLEKTTTKNRTSTSSPSALSSTKTPAPSNVAPATAAPITPAVQDPAADETSEAPAPDAPTPTDVAALPLPDDDEEELASDSDVMDMWAEVQECIDKVIKTETEKLKKTKRIWTNLMRRLKDCRQSLQRKMT